MTFVSFLTDKTKRVLCNFSSLNFLIDDREKLIK